MTCQIFYYMQSTLIRCTILLCGLVFFYQYIFAINNPMIHTYNIDGLPVQTGDIVCTMNGKPDILPGEFWRLIGRLVPGDVDHIAIYLGPDGRCMEAGALGVITFDVLGNVGETERMARQRGLLLDTFYGVAVSY